MSWSSSNNKGKDHTPDEFVALRKNTAAGLKGASAGTGPSTAAFGGDLVAQMTAGEESQLARIGGFRAGDDASYDANANALRGIVSGQELDFYNDPAFQEMLRFATDRFTAGFDEKESTNKALFARAGQELPSSSPFAQASSRIAQAESQGVADIGAQLLGQEFTAARDRRVVAAGQLSNIETARLDRARESLEAEGLPRLIRDMGLERGREEFGRRQEMLLKALGLQLEAASPHLAGTGSSKSVAIL